MASSSSPSASSPQAEMEESFSIAAGEFTDAEREYLLRKGLIYENSGDETLDISTDVGSFNSSSFSRSHWDSLLMFEESERLYAEQLNKSTNSGNDVNSPVKAANSPIQSAKSPEPELSMSKLNLNDGSVSPGYAYPVNENDEEEDKENEFRGPIIGVQRVLFQDELEKGRDPLEELKGMTDPFSVVDLEGSEKSQDDASELSDNEICVPCTQDVSLQEKSFQMNPDDADNFDVIPCTQEVALLEESSNNTDSDNVEVVPCTQAQNESLNLNQTYTSVTLEESLTEELVPCTQAPEDSLLTDDDDEVSRLDDTNNLPCSQASQVSTEGEVSSKYDEFNDTIAVMEDLLKKADEEEAREKLAAEQQGTDNVSSPEKADGGDELNDSSISEVASSQTDTDNNEEVVSKRTPLRHNRVQLLKNKKVASPSPPRSFANALLQQRGGMKMPAPVVATIEKKPLVRKPIAAAASASSSPMSTSTPKRAPVSSIPPGGKKNHTPGRGGVPKTPVVAKVDSGLRSSPFPFGLSPVAKYIYDKPAPLNFARVQSVQNPKAAVSASKASISRIPLAPTRSSQIHSNSKQTTPASATKRANHSVLRTSTYFNLTSTPPQIVANEKTTLEKKRFQPSQYTGASKVKALNGKNESPRTNDYVAHRHTGLRDESGNASFIQNTIIQKRNIPVQSRLATPKSENDNNNYGSMELRSTPPVPVRGDTFVVSNSGQYQNVMTKV